MFDRGCEFIRRSPMKNLYAIQAQGLHKRFGDIRAVCCK